LVRELGAAGATVLLTTHCASPHPCDLTCGSLSMAELTAFVMYLFYMVSPPVLFFLAVGRFQQGRDKPTLFQLIEPFHALDAGGIKVGGRDVEPMTLTTLRGLVGCV
jgi:hypothetical protein